MGVKISELTEATSFIGTDIFHLRNVGGIDKKITGTNLVISDLIINTFPIGIITPFGGTSIPSNFLLCDGSSLLRATYANLFAIIGTAFGTADGTHFNLPDLRGYFLRGRDSGAGIDPDAASRTALKPGGATGDNVGSKQADENKSHGHNHRHSANTRGTGSGTYLGNGSDTPAYTAYTNYDSAASGGNESRPKNVYVNYIIRY